MKNLLHRLESGEILLSDGAMGTMLIDRGIDTATCLESINLENPELLTEIAGLYVDAGSDIIQTNTFGASPLKLAMYSLDDRTEEINRNAVIAARKAAGSDVYIMASCGPSGKILKPHGDCEPEEIFNSFKRQLATLIDSGADALVVETMTDINEASLAVRAARELSNTIPIIASMTFDPTPRGFFTIMGVDIKTAAVRLEEAGANVIGSNCGNGIEKMIEICRAFKNHSRLPVIIQANAGLPEMHGEKLIYPETPQFMAEKIRVLIDAGVSVIGGCCGTTPEHIAAFRKIIDSATVKK